MKREKERDEEGEREMREEGERQREKLEVPNDTRTPACPVVQLI